MLVGINTKGIGPMDMGNTRTSKAKDQIDQKAAEAFSSLMNLNQGLNNTDSSLAIKTKSEIVDSNMVSKASNTVSVSQETKYDFGVGSAEKTVDKASNRDDKAITTDSERSVSDTVEDKTAKSDQVESQKTDTDSKSSKEDVSTKDKLENAMSEIRDAVKDALGLEDDELDALLQEFGIQLADLLNPDTLKQFVFGVQDVSEVDMLINENLNQMVNQLLSNVEEIKASYEVTAEMLEELDVELLPQNTDIVSSDVAVAEQSKEAEVDVEKPVEQKEAQSHVQQASVQVEDHQQSLGNQDFSQDMQNNNDLVFDNLNQAVNQALQTENVSAGEFEGAVAQTDVVRQVVEQIRVNMSKEITALTIKLNPEQLGNVQITVASKDGIMQAKIIAENEAAKNAIENSLSLLKETFENQDLKVDEIEVMVGTGDFFAETEQEMNEENQSEKSENKAGGINLNALSDDEINEDNELEVEMMKAQGNSVSYMA